MASFELAHLNIAHLREPLESPSMAEFVANLDRVNAIADAAPGFVWRMKTEDEDATAATLFGERRLINISVWRDVASLREFTYHSGHLDIMRRRREWFIPVTEAYMVLWWVPSGHRPTEREAALRLDQLRKLGPSAEAFSFSQTYEAPVSPWSAASA